MPHAGTGPDEAPRAKCSGPHRRLSRPCVVTLAAATLLQTERNALLPLFPPEASLPAAPFRLRIFALGQRHKKKSHVKGGVSNRGSLGNGESTIA